MVLKRPTALFVDEALLHDEDWFQVWQQLDVLGLRLRGSIDDNRSLLWRRWCDDYFHRDAWPRVIALDLRFGLSEESLSCRLRAAQWVSACLARISFASILVGDNYATNLALRAALRVAGKPNIVVRYDIEHFALDVADALAGRTPPVTRSESAWV